MQIEMARRNKRATNTPKKNLPISKRIEKAKVAQTKNKQFKQQIKNAQNNANRKAAPSTFYISKGREIKYAGDKSSLNIEITCNSSANVKKDNTENIVKSNISKQRWQQPRSKQPAKREKTLDNNYKTLDCVGFDESDDCILINDCDDSDVIFVDTRESSKSTRSKPPDESVILIEDDTVVETQSTPKTVNKIKKNHKNITMPSPIPAENIPNAMFSCASSTPINTSNKFHPFLFSQAQNMLMCQEQRVQENVLNSNRFGTNFLNAGDIRTEQGAQQNVLDLHRIDTNFLNAGDIRIQQRGQENVLNLNRFGSNFLNAGDIRTSGLRPVFIDGSNVAMGHSNGKVFSVKGLKICIDYFKLRGHEVTAIVPMFRKCQHQNSDPSLLLQLEKEGNLTFTPSRRINGRNIVPYDDRYIVLLAHVHKGIIVSSDNYRDLLQENPNLVETIENRILNPTWLKDMIMFPSDPLGRHGPKLDDFLRFS